MYWADRMLLMPMGYSSFEKIDAPALGRFGFARPTDRVEALVRLHEGADMPNYVKARTRFGESIFSAAITAEELSRLTSDPSVAAVEPAKNLPLMK